MPRRNGWWEVADLAGVGDIAEMLGVTRAAVSTWAARYHDFPPPVVTLSAGPIYSRRQVADWHEARVREPHYQGTPYVKRKDR